MSDSPKYYIVEASALPEVFLKVAEVKRLLSTGEADKVSNATQRWASAAVRSINIRTASCPSRI